jgi:hypothetical protein
MDDILIQIRNLVADRIAADAPLADWVATTVGKGLTVRRGLREGEKINDREYPIAVVTVAENDEIGGDSGGTLRSVIIPVTLGVSEGSLDPEAGEDALLNLAGRVRDLFPKTAPRLSESVSVVKRGSGRTTKAGSKLLRTIIITVHFYEE